MDVRAVLADIARIGPFFTVGTDAALPSDPLPSDAQPSERLLSEPVQSELAPFDSAPTEPAPSDSPSSDRGWRPLTHLYTDPKPLRERIAHVRRVLGSDDRVAASITFQGLAARLLSAPFAAAVLHDVVPMLTPSELHYRATADAPWPLRCADDLAVESVPDPADAAAALAELLLAGHFDALIVAVQALVPVSGRVLWGNVASTVAAGKRLVVIERPAAAQRAADIGARLLETGPLAGAGKLRAAAEPDQVWSFRRRSCCLYYRARDGGLCGDCVLLARRTS